MTRQARGRSITLPTRTWIALPMLALVVSGCGAGETDTAPTDVGSDVAADTAVVDTSTDTASPDTSPETAADSTPLTDSIVDSGSADSTTADTGTTPADTGTIPADTSSVDSSPKPDTATDSVVDSATDSGPSTSSTRGQCDRPGLWWP